MVTIARPRKEFDKKTFVDLVGIGCGAEEICWVFRDETGKPANIDTLSRWCKRNFGVGFHEYFKQNGSLNAKIRLRRSQIKLAETSAAMAIFLGKNLLGQSDNPQKEVVADDPLNELFRRLDDESASDS